MALDNMAVSLMNIDFSDTLDHVKTAIYNADKRIVALLGLAAGSFAVYQTLDAISTAGKTEIGWLRKIHELVRVYWNRGPMMKYRHFFYDRKLFVVNYGSYGVVPRPVLEYKRKLQDEMEGCPDEWFFLKLKDRWIESSKQVAEAVGCDPANLVFTRNVTEAINCVMKSIDLSPDDAVLITNHTYGAIRKTVDYYTSKAGAKTVTVNIPFPIESEDQIFEIYRKVLLENPNIKLAVIDHITSCSALLMPVVDLVKICKKHGALTLIDGAHAPGQIPLHIDSIGADFYGGNLHKWYFAPRGCGFLWVSSGQAETIKPSIVSHTFNKGFKERFYKQGTDDYTNFLAGGYAVSHYYPSIGGMEHIYKTNVPMREWAAELFRETWNTDSPVIPSTMKAPYMEIVQIPDVIIQYYGATNEGGEKCKIDLMKEYGVFMMVSAVNGALWCRVSCQICSTRVEYYKAAEAVKDLERRIAIRTDR